MPTKLAACLHHSVENIGKIDQRGVKLRGDQEEGKKSGKDSHCATEGVDVPAME